MYKFRVSVPEDNNNAGYGNWVYGTNATDEKYALFFGKVRARFGDNDSFSEDWESMFNYEITVEDEQGNKFFFEIYHGAGGSSIATPFSDEMPPEYQKAEKALLEYIESATPIDYVWESVYEDVPVNIKYTVKDGKAYIEHEFPENMEDFM